MTKQGCISTLVASAAFLAAVAPCACFAPPPAATATRSSPPPKFRGRAALSEKDAGRGEEVGTTKNPLELASWYAVEAFGKAFGSKRAVGADGADGKAVAAIDLTKPPSSLDETLERIRLDNDRSYFLSGEVDRYIYDEECTFADPFVSFDGRDRFIDNLSNLGSFITNYSAKTIRYDVEKGGREINMKVMVKLELGLPWKPVLAWPWGVKYIVDAETCLVTDHIESWDIAPLEGVKQIFRKPTVKIRNE